MKRLNLGLVLALALAISVSGLFAQTTIHVPADQPTIQAGIDAAVNGDTVLVAPGTYTENIDFIGKAITVTTGATSYAGAASTIISAAAEGPVVNFSTNESAAAVLNGFTVQNGHDTGGKFTNGSGIFATAASPTISNNVVTGNTCGIVLTNGSSSLIEGNDLRGNVAVHSLYPDQNFLCETPSGNTSGGAALSLIGVGSVSALGNVIEGNDSRLPMDSIGFCAAICIEESTQVLIRDNIVRNNFGQDGLYVDASALKLILIQNVFAQNQGVSLAGGFTTDGSQLVEINNTIYSGEGIAFDWGASAISNSIVMIPPGVPNYPVGFGALSCGNGKETYELDHNDAFWDNGPSALNCPAGVGEISADAQFVDPANGDFHTRATSPVIAAGDITVPGIPATDLDGKNRFVCGTIDMGAYEHHPQPPIALTSSPNPSVGGTAVTFVAQLTGNCNVPTGVITFLDGTTVLGTATLNGSAAASFSTAALTVGSHNITATYPGDFNFDPSTSNLVVQVVTGYPTATTLQVAPNPAAAFQTITLAATVSSAFGTPNGTVTFFAGTNALATATLNASGFATTTVDTLGAGTYNITAVYQATTNYATSRSPIVVEVVTGAVTSAMLVSAPNPSAFGQSVTFTANVSAGTSTAVPTGTVSFIDGTTLLNTAPLGVSASASYSTASLALGSHNVKAVYSGSADDNASTSNIVIQVVVPAATSVGLTASPNPANFGQEVTFTASLATAISGLSQPSGSVLFADQSGPLGTVPLVNGQAVFTTSSLAVGTHNVVATFAGAVGFAASSATVAEVVQNFDFTLAVTPSAMVIPSGDYEELTVTLTPEGRFTGTIGLSCGSVPVHAECSFSSNSVVLGGGQQTVTLTINTSDLIGFGDRVGRLHTPELPGPLRSLPILAGVLLPALLLRRHRRQASLLLLLIALTGLLGAQGCSSKLPAKTTPGVYPITVEATSGGISHSVALSVKVTP